MKIATVAACASLSILSLVLGTEPGLAQAVADRKYTDFLKAKRSDRQSRC